MSQSNQSPSERMLWVVFSDETDLPFLKCLRRGFRHCFVVIRDRGHWISYDPLAHYTELFLVDVPETFDLLGLAERTRNDSHQSSVASLPKAKNFAAYDVYLC
jgi:hypothetical protein